MAGDKPKHGYVAHVRDTTRRYIEELLQENVRLRATVERAGREQVELRQQLTLLRTDLERREQQHAQILDLLSSVEAETRRFEDQFLIVERQNSSLAALYTASYQLHASVRPAEVLLAIQEIVINLIGSEELAVLSVVPGGLRPLVSIGVEQPRLDGLRLDAGTVGRALRSAAPVIAGDDGDRDDDVTVCIPLAVNGHVLAVIAIFALLPQKPALTGFDRELFELLATHAATALYCANVLHGSLP